jgi:hypothetical protein
MHLTHTNDRQSYLEADKKENAARERHDVSSPNLR